MGLERLALALIALTWLQFCGAEEDPEADLPAIEGEVAVAAVPSPAVEVVVPAPSAGGTMLAVGPHPLEVSPYGDGTVIAYVRSPEPPPPATTQVTVRVPADDGESHPVMLVWDPAGGHYRGRLRRVHPVPGPVEVTLVAGGQRYEGTRPEIVIVAPEAPPPVVVEVEAPPPAVEVQAPAEPRVAVEVAAPRPPRPRVQVQIEGPRPPRHEVVVHQPGPPRPAVRVSRRGRGRARARRRRGRRARVRVRH